ncbi:hypothetical protein FOG18_05675 [Legionella israelensis]|nr:hypothetical protein FOG18_05675 [Legionella israelensis]
MYTDNLLAEHHIRYGKDGEHLNFYQPEGMDENLYKHINEYKI